MSENNYEVEANELAMALGALVRRFRATAPSEMRELSWTQKAVMKRLETDGPATTADLARAEGVKPQSMGAVIAALEEMGFVERTSHPTDGRQMNIVLTEKGVIVRKDVGDAKRAWLAEAIQKLEPEERKNLSILIALVKHLGQL